ncbi:hypothetical protein M501DRAFT_1004910 [Patellaria atrata CBS 101060]|uniref:Uncharacterized protein n=1 Tax=Patellaria atrata CBS 101060 TaxID=1346257 RepID=A0A9P4SAL1_9PEZI|nr:hypothetical protein M501DRAFT_1004910 [Patellaria atrata CBS 101060]
MLAEIGFDAGQFSKVYWSVTVSWVRNAPWPPSDQRKLPVLPTEKLRREVQGTTQTPPLRLTSSTSSQREVPLGSCAPVLTFASFALLHRQPSSISPLSRAAFDLFEPKSSSLASSSIFSSLICLMLHCIRHHLQYEYPLIAFESLQLPILEVAGF